MKPVIAAASIVVASVLASAGAARADGSREYFVPTTMLVPKPPPQAPAAPRAAPAPQHPHGSGSALPARPFAHHAPGPRPFVHERPFVHHRPFFAPVPIIVPPPAYYGYVPPPPVYYGYRPPAYVVPPPVYIEREDGYWYYCPPLGAYYPDVAECTEPWVPVPPS